MNEAYKYAAGDVIAFGASGVFSDTIKLVTQSPVSHVAIVKQVLENGDAVLMESTTLYKGRRGVQENLVSERQAEHSGRMWWLPLSKQARTYLNYDKLTEFLQKQVGKGYDIRQCIGLPLAHVPLLGRYVAPEDWRQVFCSELVGGAFEAAGILQESYNCAGLSPRDICRLRLYANCVQMKGPDKKIRYNTVQVFFPEWELGEVGLSPSK